MAPRSRVHRPQEHETEQDLAMETWTGRRTKQPFDSKHRPHVQSRLCPQGPRGERDLNLNQFRGMRFTLPPPRDRGISPRTVPSASEPLRLPQQSPPWFRSRVASRETAAVPRLWDQGIDASSPWPQIRTLGVSPLLAPRNISRSEASPAVARRRWPCRRRRSPQRTSAPPASAPG